MMDPVATELQSFVDQAWDLKDYKGYDAWLRRLLAFARAALGQEFAGPIADLGGDNSLSGWQAYRDRQAAHVTGQLARMARSEVEQERKLEQLVVAKPRQQPSTKDVFLVHGHDESAKEASARFLEKLGLNVIILHEQASEGRTIIEKFEGHSDVGFAIVLLTPDDVGALATSPTELKGRARQNVILELGYFTGKLGRRRVCGLFKAGVEVPSDFHGVLFIQLDSQGGWRAKLAQELVSAGMQIDLQGLLRG